MKIEVNIKVDIKDMEGMWQIEQSIFDNMNFKDKVKGELAKAIIEETIKEMVYSTRPESANVVAKEFKNAVKSLVKESIQEMIGKIISDEVKKNVSVSQGEILEKVKKRFEDFDQRLVEYIETHRDGILKTKMQSLVAEMFDQIQKEWK